MSKDTTTIRVSPATAARVKQINKNKNYDEIISQMVDYFHITGVDPRSHVVSPVEETKRVGERIIKVVRSIEKDRIVPLQKMIEQFLESPPNLPLMEAENVRNSDAVSVAEMEQVVKINDSLNLKIEGLEREISRLNHERNVEVTAVSTDDTLARDSILSAIAKLEAGASKGAFSSDLSISPSLFNSTITTIKNLLR